MSEKQAEAIERLDRILSELPLERLLYLQGYADALADQNAKAGQSQPEQTVADDDELPFN